MDKRKMKKLLILNLPYFLVGLFATNLGEAWRLAEGADSSAKILSFFWFPNLDERKDWSAAEASEEQTYFDLEYQLVKYKKNGK